MHVIQVLETGFYQKIKVIESLGVKAPSVEPVSCIMIDVGSVRQGAAILSSLRWWNHLDAGPKRSDDSI